MGDKVVLCGDRLGALKSLRGGGGGTPSVVPGLLSTNRAAASRGSNTRLLLLNRYSAAAAANSAAGGSGADDSRGRLHAHLSGTGGRGGDSAPAVAFRDSEDSMGQGGEIDEAIEACVRVLMRSDPNFAVQFAKNYLPSTTHNGHSSDATSTNHQANTHNAQTEPTLPSYQEALAQIISREEATTSRSGPCESGTSDVHFPPPPSPPPPPPPPEVDGDSQLDSSRVVALEDLDSISMTGAPPPYTSGSCNQLDLGSVQEGLLPAPISDDSIDLESVVSVSSHGQEYQLQPTVLADTDEVNFRASSAQQSSR